MIRPSCCSPVFNGCRTNNKGPDKSCPSASSLFCDPTVPCDLHVIHVTALTAVGHLACYLTFALGIHINMFLIKYLEHC